MVDPTGYTALDLIGFTDKGDYNPLSTYIQNDLANYNGIKWRCKVDDTTGVTPSEGLTWTAFMVLPTDHTMDMIAPVETSPSANAYVTGKQLIFNEVLYDVIDDIAIGDTLEVGVNINTSDTIVEQIEDANDAIAQNASDITSLGSSKMSYAVNTKLGAHNFAPCTLTANVTSQGVTYSVNSEKIVTATWSSTPTGVAGLEYTARDKMNLIAGIPYKLSGCPTGGAWESGNNKYCIQVSNVTDNTLAALDIGDGALFTPVAGKSYKINIFVGPNAGSSGTLTFKPLVTLIEDTDTTYTPYAMTNRELTEVKSGTATATCTSSNAIMKSCIVDRVGNVCQFLFGLQTTAVVNVGNNITFTISGIPKPKTLAMLSGYAGSTATLAQLGTDLSLTVRILGANTGNDYNILISGTYITG